MSKNSDLNLKDVNTDLLSPPQIPIVSHIDDVSQDSDESVNAIDDVSQDEQNVKRETMSSIDDVSQDSNESVNVPYVPHETIIPRETLSKVEILRKVTADGFLEFCMAMMPNWEPTKFHRLLANKLQSVYERVVKGEDVRLMVEIPPQHGKSTLISELFPAWVLSKEVWPIICASYGADLAESKSQKARDIVASDLYKTLFRMAVSPDSTSKAFWKTSRGGSYKAIGVGGGLTGMSGKCVVGSTKVSTSIGDISIAELCRLPQLPLMLSYNHEKNIVEWKRILACSTSVSKRLVRISTNKGSVLDCTYDHEVYTNNRGYVGAECLQKTDQGIFLRESLPNLQYPDRGDKKRKSPTMLPLLDNSEGSVCINSVQSLWRRYDAITRRIQQIASKKFKAKFLLPIMYTCLQTRALWQEMLNMFKSSRKIETRQQILPKSDVSTNICVEEEVNTKDMPILQNRFSAKEFLRSMLFPSMRRQLTFGAYAGEVKFELATRDGSRGVSEGVFCYPEGSNKGRLRGMQGVWERSEIDSTPYRSQSTEQSDDQSNYSMQSMPHGTPLIEGFSVYMVSDLYGEQEVFDIQVEDNHNFFANGLLVHNCIIVDDPFKDRAEADSLTVREATWKWWQSTLYTRRAGRAGIVILNTRWHLDDLCGRLLRQQEESEEAGIAVEQFDRWERITLPAIAEEDEYFNNTLFRSKGEALWPERFGLDVLAKTRNAMDAMEWASLYQQNPILQENAAFKQEWFTYFEEKDIQDKDLQVYVTVDLAISEKKSSDNTSIQVVGKIRNAPEIYHLEEYTGKFDPQVVMEHLFQIKRTYKDRLKVVGIESTGYQASLKYTLMEEQRRREVYFEIEDLKSKGKKEERIKGLIPLYKAGVLKHRRHDKELELELLQFPKGRRDDRIDALAYMLVIIKNTRYNESAKVVKRNMKRY